MFHVLSLGSKNLILRLPWLKEINPTIDWANQTLSLPESLDQSKDLFLSHAMDTFCHDSHFKPPTLRPPHHIHVNTITDQKLYEFNDWEDENQYLPGPSKTESSTKLFTADPALLPWDPP
jgi:hypothetical protein